MSLWILSAISARYGDLKLGLDPQLSRGKVKLSLVDSFFFFSLLFCRKRLERERLKEERENKFLFKSFGRWVSIKRLRRKKEGEEEEVVLIDNLWVSFVETIVIASNDLS